MRTRVLTFLCAFVPAVLCALPACGQQGWSRPRSSEPETVRPATAKEMLTQRLQQLRDGQSDSTTPEPHPLIVPSKPEFKQSLIPMPESSGIQHASFEVADRPSASVATADTQSRVSQSGAPPFLDLSQEESPDPSSRDHASPSSRHAEVTLNSSPLQVLMRAAAWIVIAMCIGSLTVLGLRHWQRTRGLLPTTNSGCRVLETLSLGPGRTVSLIEMAGFRALVASDAGGIRSLVLAPSDFQEELMGREGTISSE